MPELSNPRHERFCLLYVLLGNATEAYRQSGYRPQNADVKGPRLLGNVGIESRIAELRAQNSRKAKLSLDDAVELLCEIATTPAGEITKHSRLCESYKETEHGIELKMPSKLGAISELGRILDWHAANRVQISAGDSLNNYIVALRARPIGGEVIELENGSENP
jgi:phage terminase small subunit